MATPVRMPQLGLTMTEGKVVRWLKQRGDSVRRGEPVLEIETDKLNAEVEASADGVLRRQVAEEGTAVKVTGLLAVIAAPDEPDSEVEAVIAAVHAQTSTAAARAAPPATVQRPALAPGTAVRGTRAVGPERVLASPIARRLALELGVDLAAVAGTGPGGRITESDVRAAGEPPALAGTTSPAALERWPVGQGRPPVELPDLPRRQTIPVTGMRRLIAARLTYSMQSSAQLTLVTEADGAALVERRAALAAATGPREPGSGAEEPAPDARGPTPTYTDLLVFLVARALRDHPLLNASLVDEEVVCWDAINIGVAIAVERGLVVPVLRGADRKTVAQIASESADIVARARASRLTVDELRGGTFTITNLGMYEVDAFTPIVNPPQCAILGVGRILDRPVARDGRVVVRPTLALSLSFDHRIVDGAPAAAFLQQVKQAVEVAEVG